MSNELRRQRLLFRAGIYTVGMVLLAILLPFCGLRTFQPMLLIPWVVCYGAGLASMVLVEPFRHPKRSPYGLLFGSVVRATPPLLLVVVVLLTNQPVKLSFWISLLLSYFLMLILVMLLTIPASQASKSEETEADREKNEEKVP